VISEICTKMSNPNKLVLILVLAAIVPRTTISTDPPIVHGTALVVGIAEEGVVIGQDHLRAAGSEIFKPIVQKFSFCASEIMCGTSGLSQHNFSCLFKDSAGAQRGGQLEYNSYSWLAAIEKESSVSGKTSPKSIANKIWKKASSKFDPIECFYFHTKEGQAQIDSDGPVIFVVAGYPSGSESAEVYAVRVQYDRQNSKLVYPAPEKIFPNGSEKLPVCFVAGNQERFDAIKEGREPFISIFRGFYSRRLTRTTLILKETPTALQETLAWIAAFIDLESQFNPHVGGGSSIAVIRKGQSPSFVFMPQIAVR
jgi:hypothetical protein